jgi:PAS domain S-box-containing protein
VSANVTERRSILSEFGDVYGALDRLPLPIFAVARSGVITWLNQAAEAVVGDRRGVRFTQVVAPESRAVVNDAFTSKVMGSRSSTDYKAVLLRADGSRVPVEICSVAVTGDEGIVGVFGAAEVQHERLPPLQPSPDLTPRQAEVLAYLARGYKTDDMALAMGVTATTVRNHVRNLFGALGVHSRLEAVAAGRLRGLV